MSWIWVLVALFFWAALSWGFITAIAVTIGLSFLYIIMDDVGKIRRLMETENK